MAEEDFYIWLHRLLIVGCVIAFLYVNRGHTFDGISHMFVTARTSFLPGISDEQAEFIANTTIAFGRTAGNGSIFGLMYFAGRYVLDWLDHRFYRDNRKARLIELEHKSLMAALEDSRSGLGDFHVTVETIVNLRTQLEKHYDQLQMIRTESEKIKSKPKRPQTGAPGTDCNGALAHCNGEASEPNLFTATVRNGKVRKPPRRSLPVPKF